jgi:ATP-binding cassette subfamily F protein 3
MLEMTADRLVLVDEGTAREYDGSLDDYIALVLAGDPEAPSKGETKASRKEGRRAAAEAREKSQALRRQVKDAEAELAKLTTQRSAIDRAMFDPSSAEPALAKLTMGDLMKRRGEVERKIAAIEAAWVDASEALERAAA